MTTQPLTVVPPRGGDPDLLFAELSHVIETAVKGQPRSQQRIIGPSEIGVPCTRRLAYKLAGVEEQADSDLPWLPFVGTSLHTSFEDIFTRANAALPEPRWLLERRVCVGDIGATPVHGTCDLYDTATATVVDWKSCGPTRMKKYRKEGPSPEYRAQAHLYGRGYIALGHPVDTVGIAFVPRNGQWRERFFWHEPYSEEIAIAALERAERIVNTHAALGDQAFALMPTDPADCTFCPWWQPGATDLSRGCPGDASRAVRPDSFVTDLIA